MNASGHTYEYTPRSTDVRTVLTHIATHTATHDLQVCAPGSNGTACEIGQNACLLMCEAPWGSGFGFLGLEFM